MFLEWLPWNRCPWKVRSQREQKIFQILGCHRFARVYNYNQPLALFRFQYCTSTMYAPQSSSISASFRACSHIFEIVNIHQHLPTPPSSSSESVWVGKRCWRKASSQLINYFGFQSSLFSQNKPRAGKNCWHRGLWNTCARGRVHILFWNLPSYLVKPILHC